MSYVIGDDTISQNTALKYYDNIGNEIKVGDEILVLVPKTDATYRFATVIEFRKRFEQYGRFFCEVLVEYRCDRLYCDTKHWDQRKGKPITFNKKITKAWRSNSDIILYKKNYFNT